MAKLYHATTLSQCRLILQGGFKVGLHHAGTKSSPAGIWGCSHPGHSVDRAPLERGYSFDADESVDRGIVCGWDCPVVLAWDIERASLEDHVLLSDGTYVWVHKQPCGTFWDARKRPTSIWIHISLYKRFVELPSWWRKLQEGTAVVCRSKKGTPSDLYKAGDASPMTCGRVCSFDRLQEENWTQANESKRWYCPSCGRLYAQNKPCTGWL